MMLAADLAVSGAGVTLCELAATATPTVAIALADNQRPNFDAFARAGAAVPAGGAGDPDMIGAIATAVRSLADDAARRRAVGARGRALVDGQGAMRVARAIGRPVARRH
jgi:spore coat polysaccharide biosynthesis predicted glycosyltransferase SpsG